MSLWVLDQGELRAPTPALPARALSELASFVPALRTEEVRSSAVAVPLGDAVAAVASLLALPVSEDTVVVAGTLHPDGIVRGDGPEPRASPDAPRVVAPVGALPDSFKRLRGADVAPHVAVAPTFGHALDLALPSYAALDDVARAVHTAPLIDAGLRGPRPTFFGWRLLHRLAIAHLRASNGVDRWLVEIVRDAAARHEGHDSLCAWPSKAELRGLERGLRLEVLAHVVQSAADADWDAAGDYARRASEWLASPGERHAADAKLLGAIGRAFAAASAASDATRALTASIETFESLRLPAMATYAVSELLRVAADAAPDHARHLATDLAPRIAEVADPIGRAFVQLAIGRAWASLGDPERALHCLDDSAAEWTRAPLHARQARWRWRIQAGRELHLPDLATWRAALEALGPSEHLYLSQIDDALASGAPALEPLVALLSLPLRGSEARRLLQKVAPDWSVENVVDAPDRLAALARGWRY